VLDSTLLSKIGRDMKNTNCIHTIAERYLQDLHSGKASFYAEAENNDVLPLGDSIAERVVIMEADSHRYLVGIKPSGRPVFTHDLKLAASYDSASLALADILDRMGRYQIGVQTMPACWFSQYNA
jgi:hypothetical protein